jgi:hypothetical protein
MVMFERVRRMVDAWFRRSRKGPARRNIYDGGRQLSRKWRGDPPPADSAVRQPLKSGPLGNRSSGAAVVEPVTERLKDDGHASASTSEALRLKGKAP